MNMHEYGGEMFIRLAAEANFSDFLLPTRCAYTAFALLRFGVEAPPLLLPSASRFFFLSPGAGLSGGPGGESRGRSKPNGEADSQCDPECEPSESL